MKNNNLIKELNIYFNVFAKEKDFDKFHRNLSEYFNFIENTYPLKEITRNLFASTNTFSTVRYKVNDLYDLYVFNKRDEGVSISPKSFAGSGMNIFHKLLLNELKKAGYDDKETVTINDGGNSKKVCLGDSCYLIKGKDPQRFKIITILFKTKTGKTASEIAELLNKNSKNKTVQDGVKKEIDRLNILFLTNCKTTEKIIVDVSNRGKNVYSLNREYYNFEKEK